MFRGGTCLGKADMEPCSAANGRLQPGFRFHPTNVELVMYYLKRKVLGKCLKPELITEVDVYQFHPKDLRDFSSLKKDLNWYFFCPRGKKYGSGDRTNRATRSGYWKATGVDRVVSYQDRTVGKIKTLVYHLGKPPKGTRTDWVMHEYRLEDKKLADEGVCQGSYVLCKIFEKSGWGPKNGEQYGAPFVEEEWADDDDDEDYQMVVHWGNHNQSTSGVANVNACYSEQFCSGAVSVVSDVDQAPTPMPNVAAEIASSSRALAPYSDYAADQMLTPISVAGNLASSSMASLQYCTDQRGFEVANPLVFPQPAADVPSTSTNPVPNEDYDEIDRLLDMFVADDSDVYGNLGDLDHGTAWDWRDMEQVGGGLHLNDLDPPLDGI